MGVMRLHGWDEKSVNENDYDDVDEIKQEIDSIKKGWCIRNELILRKLQCPDLRIVCNSINWPGDLTFDLLILGSRVKPVHTELVVWRSVVLHGV